MVGHDLDHAEVSYDSPYGRHRVSWQRNGETVVLFVAVPIGTTAEVWVPGADAPVEAAAGEHTYVGTLAPLVPSRDTIRDVVADPALWLRVVETFVGLGAAADGQELARRLIKNFHAPVTRLAEYASPPFHRGTFEPLLTQALAELL